MRTHHLYCILSLFLCSCVSVKLPGSKTTSAEGVVLSSPSSPFSEITAVNADKTWLSSKTGNTISYLSECGNPSDPSLEQLENESLSGISKLVIQQTVVKDFNGREARSTMASGFVDGVPVRISILVFKRNSCNYTLSYGGIQKNFDSEMEHFNRFQSNFKAP